MENSIEAVNEIFADAIAAKKEEGVHHYHIWPVGQTPEEIRHMVATMPHMQLFSKEVYNLLRDLHLPEGDGATQIASCAEAQEALRLGMRRMCFVPGSALPYQAMGDLSQVLNEARRQRIINLGDEVAEVTLPLWRHRMTESIWYEHEYDVVFLIDPTRTDEINSVIEAPGEVTANRVGADLALGRMEESKLFQPFLARANDYWHECTYAPSDSREKHGARGLAELTPWVLSVKTVKETISPETVSGELRPWYQ